MNRFITATLLMFLSVAAYGDVPAAPTELTVAGKDYESVLLVWTDNSSNEDGFIIERCFGYQAGCFYAVATVGFDVTSFTDFIPESTYATYFVYAFNADGISEPSNVAAVVTDPLPVPPAPSDLTATAISETEIDVSWTSGGGEDYVAISMCWKRGDYPCSLEPFANVAAGKTSYAVVGLKPGSTYIFRAAAVSNTYGNDGYSNLAYATTLGSEGPPLPPSHIAVTALSASSIHVYWLDWAWNETGFEIERCTGSGCTNFALVHTQGTGIGPWVDSGLLGGTTYQYRVRAFNADGYSAYTAVAAATTHEAAPAAPTNLRASVAGNAYAQLTWSDNSTNESDFEIERCLGTWCTSMVAPANATAYRDSTVNRKTTYTYRVRARHPSAGPSVWSNTSTVTTK
jgi:hypothetical protein